MKNITLNICLLFITLLSFTCKKAIELEPIPKILYISGIVTDKQTSVGLDSVNVSLIHKAKVDLTGFFLTKEKFTTDKNGKYSFQFSQDEKYSYEIRFSKKNYRSYPDASIDSKKEYQVFNAELTK